VENFWQSLAGNKISGELKSRTLMVRTGCVACKGLSKRRIDIMGHGTKPGARPQPS